jgi:hypothetical protein
MWGAISTRPTLIINRAKTLSTYHDPMSGEDDRSVQQPQAPATPDTDPTAGAGPSGLQGNEPTSGNHSAIDANDNSDKTSAGPQEQGHIRRWRSRLAAVPAKSTTLIVTALIGFFFGIASNQVTDFVKRADDCYNSLSQYKAGVTQFGTIMDVMDDPNRTQQENDSAIQKYNKVIMIPTIVVYNKCPVKGRLEYISKNDVEAWNRKNDDLEDCFGAPSQCSPTRAYSLSGDADESADPLIRQANNVWEWGLVRRAKFVVTHLY